MVMDTLQIRMSKELVKKIDKIVKTGIYSNRADAIRDAVRKTFWSNQIGSVKLKSEKSSVELVRDARKILSEELLKKENFEEINNL